MADMLTVAEAAEALRMSERHVRRLIAKGEIVAFQNKPGGRVLIPSESIMAYLRPAFVEITGAPS